MCNFVFINTLNEFIFSVKNLKKKKKGKTYTSLPPIYFLKSFTEPFGIQNIDG